MAFRSALLTGQPSRFARSVLPVILDTNVLLRDIRARLKNQKPTYLQQAAGFGTFRFFATERVFEEVAAKLPDFIRKYGLDVEMAQRVWINEYCPLIRFVEVPDSHSDPRVAIVDAADSDDTPTAILTVMLSPALLLSVDHRSLGKAELATIEWFSMAEHAALRVTVGDSTFVSTETIFRASITSVWELGKGFIALWRTRPDIAILLSLVALIVADHVRNSGRARQVLDDAETKAGEMLNRVGSEMAAHNLAMTALSQAMVGPGKDRPVLDLVTHILAMEGPLSRTKIIESFRRRGVEVSRDFPLALDSLLRGCPVFVQGPSRRWEIGRNLRKSIQPLQRS